MPEEVLIHSGEQDIEMKTKKDNQSNFKLIKKKKEASPSPGPPD